MMARLLAITAFARHASAVTQNQGSLGTVIRNHGICTARFRGRRKARQSRYSNHESVSYTHLRAHETKANLVCRLLLEKKKPRTVLGNFTAVKLPQCYRGKFTAVQSRLPVNAAIP